MPAPINTSGPSWTGNILPNLWSHWYPSQAPTTPAVQPGTTTLPGAPASNYDSRFGGIPGVPSPGASQQQSISNNISALGPLYNLGSNLNQFTAQQAPSSLNLNLPNYGAMNQASSGNILSKLQGQIPQDVVNQLGQLSAERGVSSGSIGSPNSDSALTRALGLTSLDLQNQGEQQFSGAVARTPQGAQFNPYSFLVTPEQQQQAQYQANLLNAAPVPSSAQYAGLNALQQGRQSGYSQFPSSAPISAPSYGSPLFVGQQPLGGINPPQTGGTAYSSSFTPYSGMTQSDLDYFGLSDPQFQTGLPLSGYSGPDFTQDVDWSNLFGDAGG